MGGMVSSVCSNARLQRVANATTEVHARTPPSRVNATPTLQEDTGRGPPVRAALPGITAPNALVCVLVVHAFPASITERVCKAYQGTVRASATRTQPPAIGPNPHVQTVSTGSTVLDASARVLPTLQVVFAVVTAPATEVYRAQVRVRATRVQPMVTGRVPCVPPVRLVTSVPIVEVSAQGIKVPHPYATVKETVRKVSTELVAARASRVSLATIAFSHAHGARVVLCAVDEEIALLSILLLCVRVALHSLAHVVSCAPPATMERTALHVPVLAMAYALMVSQATVLARVLPGMLDPPVARNATVVPELPVGRTVCAIKQQVTVPATATLFADTTWEPLVDPAARTINRGHATYRVL